MTADLRAAASEAFMWLVGEWADDEEAQHMAARQKRRIVEDLRAALAAPESESSAEADAALREEVAPLLDMLMTSPEPSAEADAERCYCGREAYRFDSGTTRTSPARCSGCAVVRGRCKCEPATEPEPSAEAHSIHWPVAHCPCCDALHDHSPEPSAETRLIAACPDCGDEFDVTDEAGRLRTEAHARRHHPEPSAEADAALDEAARAVVAEYRHPDGPEYRQMRDKVDALEAALSRLPEPIAMLDEFGNPAGVPPSAEADAKAEAPSEDGASNRADVSDAVLQPAQYTPNPSAEADASPDTAAALREVERALRNAYGDVADVWPHFFALRAALSRPATPPLDVEVVATMRQRPQFRFEATTDDFAREYDALANTEPVSPESAS